jgi:hypothetical protein
MRNLTLLTLGIMFSAILSIKSVATKPVVAVSTQGCNILYVGIDNRIDIVAQQRKSIQRSQISAFMDIYDHEEKSYQTIRGKDGHFLLKPDSTGILTLIVNTASGNYEKKFHVRPIEAVVMFGGIKKSGKMSLGRFKAQGGVIPVIECCGFDARCDMVEFEVLKINAKGIVFRGKNKGGAFDENIRPIINSAQVGDLYWFRTPLYRCPGSKELQEGQDIAIEIE